MKYVFDVEANGLLNEATRIWCITLYSLDKSKTVTFTDELDDYRSIEEALQIMSKAEQLIGHNIYAYDLPLLEKLKSFKFTGKILDTLLLSQLLNFDRGGHGLAQWGERFGIPKPKQEQWEFFEKAMLNR
jgi:DNA polymerase III alpha subunit (gram-positive type)